MARKGPELQKILENEAITKQTHYEFLYHLESALLLALQEQGRLNMMQQRHAQESLNQQRRKRAKALLEKDIHP